MHAVAEPQLPGGKRTRAVLAVVSLAAFAAVLVVLCTAKRGTPDALFGEHNVDPSMPAPMLGGNDDDALPEDSAAWGGVGPGGTFLGRSMSKRRRVIKDQKDLWSMAEQGVGSLVAMSKGKWHPRPLAAPERQDGGETRAREGGLGGRAPDERRRDSYYDEVRAGAHAGDGHGRVGDDGGQRESWLLGREAADDRRGADLDRAISDAGEDSGSNRPAGHDVASLRSAITRMKHDLGATEQKLEEQVRRDEDRQRRQRQGRDEIAMHSAVRTSVLASAPGSEEQTAGAQAKYDALGHRIEWPLLERPKDGPSDSDEAVETVSDSVEGLEHMVGAVEDDVHGLLEKSSAQARKQHSKTALEFRHKWGALAKREGADVSCCGNRDLEDPPSGQLQGGARGASDDHAGHGGSLAAHPRGQSLSRKASAVSPAADTAGMRKKVYMRNRLSELADERTRLGQQGASTSNHAREHASAAEMRLLAQAVSKIEGQISSLAVQSRARGQAEGSGPLTQNAMLYASAPGASAQGGRSVAPGASAQGGRSVSSLGAWRVCVYVCIRGMLCERSWWVACVYICMCKGDAV